jgi:hypothetical protein
VRTRWTTGIGALAAAGLVGAIFAGVANAEEPPTASDRSTQEQDADGTTPTPPAEGRDGGHDRSGPHSDAHRDGIGDGVRGHHGARPDGMGSGDHEDCDEQSDGSEADA